MKHYIFNIYDSKVNKIYGGCLQRAKIYRLKRNIPYLIGTVEWQTASYRGAVSEVFNKLMELGEIPKKFYSSSISEWRGRGYFAGKVTKNYSISEV